MATLMPAAAHAQCVRMVGSGQIVCPSYGGSTSPVYSGPGYYRPGQGALGAGQLVVGTVTTGYNVYARNPQGLQYSTATLANGYYNLKRGPMITYQPRIAYPAPRPAYRRW